MARIKPRAHFNINELSGNNAKVPLPPRGRRDGVGLKEAEGRQFGDKSRVIKHFGDVRATVERRLSDGRWVACLAILAIG